MKKKKYYVLKLVCIFILLSSNLIKIYSEEKVLQVFPVMDGILLASTALFGLSSEILLTNQDISVPWDLQKASINSLDKFFVFPFSEETDNLGKIFLAGSLISPAILAFNTEMTDWPGMGIVYFEAFLFTNGCKNVLKYFTKRYRPYMYYEEIQSEQLEDSNFANSFPSGHTSFVFTSASFTSYMFAHYNPDSKWIIPVTSLSFGLAAAVAFTRVLSGNHFLSDVLTGALIGTVSGIFFPFIHMNYNQKNNSGISKIFFTEDMSIIPGIGLNSISVSIYK